DKPVLVLKVIPISEREFIVPLPRPLIGEYAVELNKLKSDDAEASPSNTPLTPSCEVEFVLIKVYTSLKDVMNSSTFDFTALTSLETSILTSLSSSDITDLRFSVIPVTRSEIVFEFLSIFSPLKLIFELRTDVL